MFNMEQGFRIALWMFFLIGYVQLRAVPCKLNRLTGLKCDNVNFTSPSNNVTETCSRTALEYFMNKLKHTNCGNEQFRIDQIHDMLKHSANHTKNKSTECEWEKKESSKPFADFVKALEEFLQKLNTISTP